MTTTKIATMTQHTIEALFREGGPTHDDNPMRPSAAIVDEVWNLQGQNLYGQEGDDVDNLIDGGELE